MLLFFLLPLPVFLQVVNALLNVSIDDVNPMITYSGQWEASSTHKSGLDFGGSHTLSSDSKAKATFGVAVYYLSARWPYAVSTRLSLDGGPTVLVNLTDPDTSPTPPGGSQSALSSFAWSATNLANKSHTVVATIGNFIIVDGFIFTVDNGTSPTSSSSSASLHAPSTLSSPSSSATLSSSSAGASMVPNRKNGLTIGLATVFALTVVIAAVLLGFAYYNRRRERRARSARPKSLIDDWGSMQHGRGAYAALPRGRSHPLEMSDASSSLLLSTYPTLSDPWEPDDAQYQDLMAAHTQRPSEASHGSSASPYSRLPNTAGLPPGAMSPAVPGPYMDRAPPDDDGAQSMGLSRAPSSHVLAPSHTPQDGEITPGPQDGMRISSPPAYSER
ncbi:hypothetical protein C8R43DRAFT_1191793 [Mycena crocata]|nr:hypothetical protein C8R43DRAFT_1191793 [Mycena crocata]